MMRKGIGFRMSVARPLFVSSVCEGPAVRLCTRNKRRTGKSACATKARPNRFFPLVAKVLLGASALLLLCSVLRAQKQPPAKPIDLNVATLKELEELPGVGPVTAQRIIDARQKSGRFHRVEDLLAIRGMSTKRLEALRRYVTVSPAPPAPPAKNK